MDKGLLVFEKYCRSEATKEHYRYWFNDFLGWCKTNVEPMITGEGLLQNITNVVNVEENYVN